MKASGWGDWLGEDVGKLNASMVEVMALREEVRLFLLVKRLASQLMVGVVGQDGRPAGRRWGGK